MIFNRLCTNIVPLRWCTLNENGMKKSIKTPHLKSMISMMYRWDEVVKINYVSNPASYKAGGGLLFFICCCEFGYGLNFPIYSIYLFNENIIFAHYHENTFID